MGDTFYSIKRFLRVLDGRIIPRRKTIVFRGRQLSFVSPYWWNAVSQEVFDEEIVAYFDALGDFVPSHILDIGAAEGHFSIAAVSVFAGCSIYAFEPAQRQRVILSRNLKLNHVAVQIEPRGLWNASSVLPFRTVGAESSLAPASRFQGRLTFPEMIPVISLDGWVQEKGIERLDLIKMDVEGAELEILEGAKAILKRFRPRLLIQAYHLREGERTFGRCAATLEAIGYRVHEFGPGSGLLVAE